MRFIFFALFMLWVLPTYADDSCLPGYMISYADGAYKCRIWCPGGTYLAMANDSKCTDVGPEYWAPASNVDQGKTSTRNRCPDGMFTVGYGVGADEELDCGHAFHIGDSVLHLSGAPISSPGLNFLYNGKKYYAGATNLVLDASDGAGHTVNVMDKNGAVYFIYDTTQKDRVIELSTEFDPADYVISGGNIISVNQNVYIEGTGIQYINTGDKANTRHRYELDCQLTDIMKTGLWGVRNTDGYSNEGIFAYTWRFEPRLGYPSILHLRPVGGGYIGLNIEGGNNLDRTRLVIDTGHGYILYNDTQINMSIPIEWESDYDIFILNNNVGGKPYNMSQPAKVYSYKVYDADDNLIMHMVPVPRGLMIGDFQVPGTGMWDIVTQTYYPNAGSGFFLYGRDG